MEPLQIVTETCNEFVLRILLQGPLRMEEMPGCYFMFNLENREPEWLLLPNLPASQAGTSCNCVATGALEKVLNGIRV
jgi:hypothetical protein